MQQQRAFTLIELSIVLVIIGLLVGGVLTGQSLIRAAELRSITTQEQRYIAAVQTFRDKYFALPGDMPNATTYWGIAGGTGSDATCASTVSTTAATCNGNGDGMVWVSSSAVSNEPFRFWQHLANAGLIEGAYSGMTPGPGLYAKTVANSPAGRLSSSVWFAFNYGNYTSSDSTLFVGQYDNILEFATLGTTPLLKPEEAYNIDTKLDDGSPSNGRVVMRASGGYSQCTTASSPSDMTGTYRLNYTGLVCGVVFRQAF